jgi:hypothetical protein
MKHGFYEYNTLVVFHSLFRIITVNKNGHNCEVCPFIYNDSLLLIEINAVIFYCG